MPFDHKILPDKIAQLKENVENGNFADALVAALNSGNFLMQKRIFQNNADIEGQSFGNYIGTKRTVRPQTSTNRTQQKRNKAITGLQLTSYQRKRARAGRQVIKKDLELTGGLRRSIEVVIINELSAALQFSNPEAAKIARGQEQQITNIRQGRKATTKGSDPTPIFTFSESERKHVTEEGLQLIKKIIKPVSIKAA